MDDTRALLDLLLHPDPLVFRQGTELLYALPGAAAALFGASGHLWRAPIDGVLSGMSLLRRMGGADPEAVWAWALACMTQTGPLFRQSTEQHRYEWMGLSRWALTDLPPHQIVASCQRRAWLLRRLRPDDAPLWAEALGRLQDLPGLLHTMEFLLDTLDDDPDPAEISALHEELLVTGRQLRPLLAEMIILLHLGQANQDGKRAARTASQWHRHHLGALLLQAAQKSDHRSS